MRVLRRTALLAGSLGLAVSTAVALTPAVAGAAVAPGASTIDVQGTLLVAESDGPDGGSTSYAVQLADGDLVPVAGPIPADARTGATFTGRLALPASVASATASRAAALQLVDRRSLTLSVVGTPTITAAASTGRRDADRAPAVRRGHDNRACQPGGRHAAGQRWPRSGTTGRASPTARSSGLTVPATVTHYNTAVADHRLRAGGRLLQRGAGGRGEVPGHQPVQRLRPTGRLRPGHLRERHRRRRGDRGIQLRQRWGPDRQGVSTGSTGSTATRPATTMASSTPTPGSAARRWSTTACTT